ncbi:hypothetical protein HDV06_005210 [Boothiomyces sp. JEL0866]|nr:hypothetical protein HDV06_005210 [Boothiomyces sp. JEL0866]
MMYRKITFSCDFCTRRKRKCDRKQPCSLCESRRLNCEYTKQKLYETQLTNIENRIKHMEQTLIKPNNSLLQKRDKLLPDIRLIVLPETLLDYLFHQDHEHLLQLRFKRFPTVIYGVTEQYYRESAKIFWPLRFALYASGALFISQDQIPKGISDRIELVNIYLQKAQSFNYASKCDHLTVLTLEIIFNICYNINSTKEAILYFRLALQHAKLCKINSELGISRISSFDYERENIRRIWWLLYRDLSFLSNILGHGTISEGEFQVFLPKSNYYFESPSTADFYGVEIMSSAEWYTAIPAGLDLDAYHTILHRIQLKVFQHFEMELSDEDPASFFSAATINASLNDWMDQFMPYLQEAMKNIRNETNREMAWFTLYIALIYNSIRINLVLPSFMRNVIKGKDVKNLLYFDVAFEATTTSAILVNMVIKYNPNLDYFATAALLTLFPTAVFALCCTKMKILESHGYYNDIVCGIKNFSRAFQKMNQFHSMLQLLESKDLVETVIYYGIFVTRQQSEFFERPSTRHY